MLSISSSREDDRLQSRRGTYSSVSESDFGLEVSLLDCPSFSSNSILSNFEPLSPSDGQARSIFRQELRQECDLSANDVTSWCSEDCQRETFDGDDCNYLSECSSFSAPYSTPKRKRLTSSQPTKRCCRSWIHLANPVDASSFESVTMLTNDISSGLKIAPDGRKTRDQVLEWSDAVNDEDSLNGIFEIEDTRREASLAE